MRREKRRAEVPIIKETQTRGGKKKDRAVGFTSGNTGRHPREKKEKVKCQSN